MDTLNDPLIAIISPDDEIFGYAPKSLVHQHGLLHRAFSVFVFNTNGELLLQQRANGKYHSPGLWTNTCCGHQTKNEELIESLHRRLMEEMGIKCEVSFLFKFTYHIAFDNGLTEHETDYVFGSVWNGIPKINPDEANDFRWINLENLKLEIQQTPDNFTYWLKYIISNFANNLENFTNTNKDK